MPRLRACVTSSASQRSRWKRPPGQPRGGRCRVGSRRRVRITQDEGGRSAGLRGTGCRVRAAGHGVQDAGCGLWAAGCGLRGAGPGARATERSTPSAPRSEARGRGPGRVARTRRRLVRGRVRPALGAGVGWPLTAVPSRLRAGGAPAFAHGAEAEPARAASPSGASVAPGTGLRARC